MILDPPKRKNGQCLSCIYFYIEGKEFEQCGHIPMNNTELTDFCYDWEDIEDIYYEE